MKFEIWNPSSEGPKIGTGARSSQFAAKGKSLSGYERNRVYIHSVVAADFNGDGMEDLLVRQTGGGSLLLFENRSVQFP